MHFYYFAHAFFLADIDRFFSLDKYAFTIFMMQLTTYHSAQYDDAACNACIQLYFSSARFLPALDIDADAIYYYLLAYAFFPSFHAYNRENYGIKFSG